MRPFLLAIAVVGLLSAVCLAGDDTGKTDKEEIQDTWALVAMEANGHKEVFREVAKDGSARVVITADTFTLSLACIGGFTGEGTYKIDSSKRPREIDVTFRKGEFPLQEDRDLKGKTWQGIYSLRGDKLKICFDRSGKGRPKTFVTKKEDGLILIYLDRE